MPARHARGVITVPAAHGPDAHLPGLPDRRPTAESARYSSADPAHALLLLHPPSDRTTPSQTPPLPAPSDATTPAPTPDDTGSPHSPPRTAPARATGRRVPALPPVAPRLPRCHPHAHPAAQRELSAPRCP